MLDLRRFPVSDEFDSSRKTFSAILDRMKISIFLSSHYFRKCKLFEEGVAMS